MIKLVYVLARRPDVSKERFHDYWLNTHGPLVRSHAQAIRAKKYIQSHTIDTPLNAAFWQPRGMLPPVDGITEVWWDSLDDVRKGFLDSPGREAIRILAEDEEKFIDIAKSQVFLTEEHVIFDHTGQRPLGPNQVKITYLLMRRDGMTDADCHKTWKNDHGPLVRDNSAPVHMRKYIQSHAVAPDFNAQLQSGRGLTAPLTGITEVWLDSIDDLQRAFETEEGRNAGQIMLEDEKRFVSLPQSRCFLTKEHLIFDYTKEKQAAA